jgi:hypothetical protein
MHKKGLTKEQVVERLAAARKSFEQKNPGSNWRASSWTAKLWRVRRGVFEGRHVFFDPATLTATSYNWWHFVRVIKGKVVYNCYSYSSNTTKDQQKVSSILRTLGIKIDEYVSVEAGLQDFESAALEPLYISLFSKELALKNPRRAKRLDDARVKLIANIKRDIARYRALGAKLSFQEVKSLKREMYAAEKARLEKIAADAKETRALIKQSRLDNGFVFDQATI